MITGIVTADREATIPIEIEGPAGRTTSVQAAIDTGFDRFLVLPSALVRELSLPSMGAKIVTLADGSQVELPLVVALIHWHGQPLHVPALQADGGVLIGMALLEGSDLRVRVIEGGEVQVRPI